MLGSQLEFVPNSLYYGDCLEVLKQWPASVVDFVYLDPPFNSKSDYNVLYGSRNGASAQTRVFSDTWHWDTAAAERMENLERASVYLHCDPTASHYLKLVCDGVFGPDRFKNEIVWKRTSGRSDAKRYGRVHDVILYYAERGAVWNTIYLPHNPEYVKRAYVRVDLNLRPLASRPAHGTREIQRRTRPTLARGRSGRNRKNVINTSQGGDERLHHQAQPH